MCVRLHTCTKSPRAVFMCIELHRSTIPAGSEDLSHSGGAARLAGPRGKQAVRAAIASCFLAEERRSYRCLLMRQINFIMLVYLCACCQSRGRIQTSMIGASAGYSAGPRAPAFHVDADQRSEGAVAGWAADAEQVAAPLPAAGSGEVSLLRSVGHFPCQAAPHPGTPGGAGHSVGTAACSPSVRGPES